MDYLSFQNILYACAIGLIAIGLVGMVTSNHLFRMVLALAIAEAGGNLFMVLAGWRPDAVAPIVGVHPAGTAMVDPIPQSLVLTSIVIGVGVQALAVAVILRIHQRYGTLDMRKLRERFELEVAAAAGIAPPGSAQAPVGERPLPPPIPDRSALHAADSGDARSPHPGSKAADRQASPTGSAPRPEGAPAGAQAGGKPTDGSATRQAASQTGSEARGGGRITGAEGASA